MSHLFRELSQWEGSGLEDLQRVVVKKAFCSKSILISVSPNGNAYQTLLTCTINSRVMSLEMAATSVALAASRKKVHNLP